MAMVDRRRLQDVRILELQYREPNERRRKPWYVRWKVDGRPHAKTYLTKAEADRHRSELISAQRAGEAFDPETGTPVSWLPNDGDTQVHVWVRRWVSQQWPEWAPRTRTSDLEALSRFVPLVRAARAPEPPAELRTYLLEALAPDAVVDDAHECERWLARWSLPLSALTRDLLSDVELKLGLGLEGQPLAASTAGRYRKVAHSCVRRAVELGTLPTDPWPPAPKGRSRRKATRQRRSVDLKKLPSPTTMAATIKAIRSHQPGSRKYQVMTSVMYFGGLRPSEVVMLRPRAFDLPTKGWGRIDVTEADIDWDEPGEPKTGDRSVPIPPVLVELVRGWIAEFAIGGDQLLFRTRHDNRPTEGNWGRALKRALKKAGHGPIRVYDVRHAAATTWLQAGVPLGEAARRLGHSVETLVTTYVGALEGDEEVANTRIETALAVRLSDITTDDVGSTRSVKAAETKSGRRSGKAAA